MDRYEQLAVVGEGSYGVVMKCKHRDSEQIVAIKKFLETEEDATVRRMALREIRMLKKLKHENLVTMLEVFRYRKRFYLVFEYVEGTVLDELEKMPGGLGEDRCRERIYQITRAVNFCHMNNVIHRDIKPENVLVSSMGVVKLCDFGFARYVGTGGEPCTEYVATRWYRAPELLVGEQVYGSSVDIWAIGCLFAEMMTGDPLFPGESDVDQLYIIIKLLGKPCSKHQQLMTKNTQLKGMARASSMEANGINKTFTSWPFYAMDFLISCLKMDPQIRPTADELLKHQFFTHDRFPMRFLPALREKVVMEFNDNPLLRRFKSEILMSSDRKDEVKLRKSSYCLEPPKWKISLVEGHVKRKFSCDTTFSCDSVSGSDKNLYMSKSGQKLIPIQKQSQSLAKQGSLSKEKLSKQSLGTSNVPQVNLDYNNQSQLQMLQKTLESFSKSGIKSEIDRPASALKETTGSPLTLQPPSPPQFQSLQPSLLDYNKSPSLLSQQSQNILHPSINNICFGKDPPKKSPNLLQTIHNTSLKTTFNQVPLLHPPRGQYLKRLDRNVVLDTIFVNVEPVAANTNNVATGPSWLNNVASNHLKKKEKGKTDDFSLPNLPGASLSPSKTKKKPQMSPEVFTAQTITPEIRYKKAKRKYVN